MRQLCAAVSDKVEDVRVSRPTNGSLLILRTKSQQNLCWQTTMYSCSQFTTTASLLCQSNRQMNCPTSTYHKRMLLLGSLESSVAELARSVDELQFNFLERTTTCLCQQRLQQTTHSSITTTRQTTHSPYNTDTQLFYTVSEKSVNLSFLSNMNQLSSKSVYVWYTELSMQNVPLFSLRTEANGSKSACDLTTEKRGWHVRILQLELEWVTKLIN